MATDAAKKLVDDGPRHPGFVKNACPSKSVAGRQERRLPAEWVAVLVGVGGFADRRVPCLVGVRPVW